MYKEYDYQEDDIICIKEFSVLKYPCIECDKADCNKREEYEKIGEKSELFYS